MTLPGSAPGAHPFCAGTLSGFLPSAARVSSEGGEFVRLCLCLCPSDGLSWPQAHILLSKPVGQVGYRIAFFTLQEASRVDRTRGIRR